MPLTFINQATHQHPKKPTASFITLNPPEAPRAVLCQFDETRTIPGKVSQQIIKISISFRIILNDNGIALNIADHVIPFGKEAPYQECNHGEQHSSNGQGVTAAFAFRFISTVHEEIRGDMS